MSTTKMPRKDRQEQRNQERDLPGIKTVGVMIAVALLCLAVAWLIRPTKKEATMKAAVHFVGFGRYDQHYWNAVAAFGPPVFLHQRWDRRAQREIDESDVVVFAKGGPDQPFAAYNGDDEYYDAA